MQRVIILTIALLKWYNNKILKIYYNEEIMKEKKTKHGLMNLFHTVIIFDKRQR